MVNKILRPFLTASLFVLISASAAFSSRLNVALYPDVPRLDQFKEIIETEWAKVAPGSSIVWQDWDGGYSDDPKSTFDVYVFDAAFMDYFYAKGYLQLLSPNLLEDPDDILDYARKGVMHNTQIYGFPYMGCTSVLFYHSNDKALAAAETLTDLTTTLGECTFYTQQPPANIGLMPDFSNRSANAGYYVQSLEMAMDTFPVPLPFKETDIDPATITRLRQVINSSSFQSALYEAPQSYQRARWFGAGKGRAYVDYTESLSVIDPAQYDNISLKIMPWADNKAGIKKPLFYSDVVGIHPATKTRGTTETAIKFAQFISSAEIIGKCIGPYKGKGPQYLMPVRHKNFKWLAAEYIMYSKIYDMVKANNPVMLNLGERAREWFTVMEEPMTRLTIADPICYCDKPAGPIWNDADAKAKCPKLCEPYGGWNGQWTTTSGGNSVCGCNQPCK